MNWGRGSISCGIYESVVCFGSVETQHFASLLRLTDKHRTPRAPKTH